MVIFELLPSKEQALVLPRNPNFSFDLYLHAIDTFDTTNVQRYGLPRHRLDKNLYAFAGDLRHTSAAVSL